jgi:hypothetical protein
MAPVLTGLGEASARDSEFEFELVEVEKLGAGREIDGIEWKVVDKLRQK